MSSSESISSGSPAGGAAGAGDADTVVADARVVEVLVELGESSYAVKVGHGVRRELGARLPAGARRAAVVTQANIGWAEDLGLEGHSDARNGDTEAAARLEQDDFAESGESRRAENTGGGRGTAGKVEKKIFLIPDGEEAKTMVVVERLCRDFADWGLTRGDAVVGAGGGVATDVAGFAAAIYHRGLPVLHVPTSLLGQVDAAIGGKTGVNLPEGKNLVGAFWQPSAVLCDTETLSTLPEREFRSGCGEIAKYEFLGAAEMWAERQAKMQAEALDAQGEHSQAMQSQTTKPQTAQSQTSLSDMPLTERIAACVNFKAAIVASDERESGRRALLNYGHTLAHALEIAGGFELTHGEAVGIGLVYASEVAHLLGRIDAERVAEHRKVVSSYGLATSLTQGFGNASAVPSPESLIALFARDKKAIAGITFVLDGPAGPEVVKEVPRDILQEALELVL